ncbi:MAG: glycosyltransferase family 2 protein [Chloroflexota bacterium]
MEDTRDAQWPSLSLVVPCYSTDRYEDLMRLVASLEAQTQHIDQVIFVVQQSQVLCERLRAFLDTSACSRSAQIAFIDDAPGVARARNRGIDCATGDIIAFTDDDGILAMDWAEQTRRAYCENPRMIGLAGAILPMWDSPAMAWFPRELYWMLSCTYWETSATTPVRNGYGVNMSFRREAFAARRFDESLGVGAWATGAWRGVGGEEPELCVRLKQETGRDIFYIPEVRAWHRVRPYRLSIRTIVRRAYWEGRFKAVLERAHRRNEAVLDTEHALLHMVADNSICRLKNVISQPSPVLRQQVVVTLAVASVLCGYAEGKARTMLRRGKGAGDKAPKPNGQEDQ